MICDYKVQLIVSSHQEIINGIICSSSRTDIIPWFVFSSCPFGRFSSLCHPLKEKPPLIHIPTYFLDFFLTFRFLGPDFPYFDSTYASHSTFYFLTPTDPWFSRETCQLLGSGEKKLKKKEKREGKGYWKRKTPLLHLFLFSHLLTLPPTMLPQKPCLFWFKSKLNLILATCIMGSVIRNYDRNYGCPWH